MSNAKSKKKMTRDELKIRLQERYAQVRKDNSERKYLQLMDYAYELGFSLGVIDEEEGKEVEKGKMSEQLNKVEKDNPENPSQDLIRYTHLVGFSLGLIHAAEERENS